MTYLSIVQVMTRYQMHKVYYSQETLNQIPSIGTKSMPNNISIGRAIYLATLKSVRLICQSLFNIAFRTAIHLDLLSLIPQWDLLSQDRYKTPLLSTPPQPTIYIVFRLPNLVSFLDSIATQTQAIRRGGIKFATQISPLLSY